MSSKKTSDNPYDIELNGGSRPLTPSQDTSPSYEYCTLSIEQTVSQLRSDLSTGLTSVQDVTQRRGLHGLNELNGDEEENLAIKFLQTFYQDPLILLLIGSAAISFFMGNIDDSVSITLAIVIVVTVGFVQEYRSEQSLQALNKLVPAEAHLIRNGSTQDVLAAQLVPGDLVHFDIGDRIPADIRLTEAIHLTIDESNLTGETDPVHKDTSPAVPKGAGIPLTERNCIAYMGTLVRDGHGSGVVVGTGHNTAFGAVFEMMNDIEKPKTPLQNTMDKLGKDLSIVSFIVIGIICLIGIIQGRSWLEMFQVSVSLAVAAIPEGLPIIVTVTLALGVLRMARHKAIVRRLPSVETLGSVNVICSDKTGTLTQNHMTVKKIWTVDMNSESLTVDKDVSKGQSLRQYLTDDVKQTLETANICNNAKYSQEAAKFVGNPTDIALLEVLSQFELEDIRSSRSRTHELPFSSSRKFMAISAHTGDISKTETYAKGATERILTRSTHYLTKDKKVEKLTEELHTKIHEAAHKLALKGLRVLAFGHVNKGFEDEPSGLVFDGLIGMKDPPRPSVKNAIAKLIHGGVHVIMITGDSETTAVQIAKEIGMNVGNPEKSVINGEKLETLDEETLSQIISSVSVFARTTPEQKVQIVRALQRRGDVVAMTGDGVNDAPALKLADIGISMGKMGTDVAKEASDMVLTNDDFSTILNAIEEGKGIFNNIQNFLTFQLSTSVAALSLIAISTFFKLPNPLNAMQILWINILMDGPPAQSLGVEPVDHEVMNKPPRKRNARILTEELFKRLLSNAFFVIVGTIYVYIKEMNDDNQVTARDTTMTFTCFVLFDMFNALSCRHATKSIFELGFKNQMFNFAVLGSLLGQLCAIYIPFFQSIFQTEALYFSDLVFLTLLSSSVFLFDEGKKYIRRQRRDVYSVV